MFRVDVRVVLNRFPCAERVDSNMIGPMDAIASFPARMAILLLKAYRRWISPYLMPACRFYPTCSVYAMEVISSFGIMKGGYLTLKRLIKCQPFHEGGVDLPPKPSTNKHGTY